MFIRKDLQEIIARTHLSAFTHTAQVVSDYPHSSYRRVMRLNAFKVDSVNINLQLRHPRPGAQMDVIHTACNADLLESIRRRRRKRMIIIFMLLLINDNIL